MGWADDMARFDHQADLTGLTVPQLVARLRGDYGDGVSYAATPLNFEAAKRLEELHVLTEIAKTADRVVAQMDEIVARASIGGCCKDCKFWGKNMFSGDDGSRECVNPKLSATICAESGDQFGNVTSIQTQPEFGCIQFEASTKP